MTGALRPHTAEWYSEMCFAPLAGRSTLIKPENDARLQYALHLLNALEDYNNGEHDWNSHAGIDTAQRQHVVTSAIEALRAVTASRAA